jgi:hypothetical protein
MTPLEYRRIIDSKENEKKKELSIEVHISCHYTNYFRAKL